MLRMPNARRRGTVFVVAAGVVVALVAASVWAVDRGPHRPSAPQWVRQSAQRTGDEFPGSPATLVFASKGTLGWGGRDEGRLRVRRVLVPRALSRRSFVPARSQGDNTRRVRDPGSVPQERLVDSVRQLILQGAFPRTGAPQTPPP